MKIIFKDRFGVKLLREKNHYFKENKSWVSKMNYCLPRYDLPLVLGYTGPGLYFYSPSSENINNLIPSFSKQEDLLAKSKNLEDQTSIKKLYNTCLKYLKPIIALAVCAGMRKGEILNLKWPDVDFRRRIITILETKSQKKREIPIGIGVSRLLLKQKKHQDSPYIFCHKDGRRIGSFGKAFGKALKKIGIKDFTFFCGGSSVVEHRPSKPMVAGSNPVPRSMVSVAQSG